MIENSEYLKLVEEAKVLVNKQAMVKLKLAKLAIEACTIRHGGRSGNLYTLTKFSNDIGVPFKSLSKYVITYKMVVSKIPNEIKTEDDWNKAMKVSEKMAKQRALINKINGKPGTKSLIKQDLELRKSDVLQAFKEQDEKHNSLKYAHEAMTRALYNLSKIDTYLEQDEKFLISVSESLNSILEVGNKLNDRVIFLMKQKKKKTIIRKAS